MHPLSRFGDSRLLLETIPKGLFKVPSAVLSLIIDPSQTVLTIDSQELLAVVCEYDNSPLSRVVCIIIHKLPLLSTKVLRFSVDVVTVGVVA